MSGQEETLKITRLCIIVLGLVTLGFGLNSHFRSSWLKLVGQGIEEAKSLSSAIPYEDELLLEPIVRESCHVITLDKYFVSVLTLSFPISVLFFLLDLRFDPLKWADLIVHGSFAVLLLFAAIGYIFSALEIDKLVRALYANGHPTLFRERELDFKTAEKITSGSLTAILSVFYAMLTFINGRAIGLNMQQGSAMTCVILICCSLLLKCLHSEFTNQCNVLL